MDFDAPLAALGGLSPRRFLTEYWQKKPLLVRGAFPEAASVVSPDDVKRLAQRDDLVSRLILQDGGEYPWELRHGPLSPRDVRTLRGKWAILVQAIETVVPEAKALLDPLAFLPRWRFDDVMVSLAPDGAGVGAHIDHYDVFLVQGHGQRRWRIGHAPVDDDAVQDGLDVAVLERFDWTHEYVLNPGDALYLPPRIAHEGVALGECITISLGFRAPSAADLVGGWLEEVLLDLPESRFYEDPDLTPTDRPGELAPEAVERARRLLLDLVDHPEGFANWLGRHLTEPRREAMPLDEGFDDDFFDPDALDVADAASGDGALAEEPDVLDPGLAAFEEEMNGEMDFDGDGHPGAQAVADFVRAGLALRHVPGTRFAYLRHPNGDATLFAHGLAFRLEPDLAFAAPLLADRERFDAHDLLPHLDAVDFPDLLAALLDTEALEWETEEG